MSLSNDMGEPMTSSNDLDTCTNDPAPRFYRLQAICTLLFWLLFRIKSGKQLYELAAGAVCTRPHWLPAQLLLRLHRLRVPAFVLMPVLMALASRTSSWLLQLVTALVTSVYHLIESSVTNRHGEYPLLMNSWAMLLPPAYAHAASLGIAINFVLSSGVAKLKVGGTGWMSAQTMRAYLDIYRSSRSSPPLSKSFNSWLASQDWATKAIGAVFAVCE